MSKVLKRWAQEDVKRKLKSMRIVMIAGARQSGKSTLLRACVKPGAPFFSLDNPETMRLALDSPNIMVTQTQTKGTTTIDEIQKYPLMINYIKSIVDLDNRKGQFLISGSSDIRAIPEIKESLAGRMSRIPLRTLAVGEIYGRKPQFLKRAFAGDFPRMIEGAEKAEVLRLAVRGGYPEVIGLNDDERHDWYRDYTDNLLLHDLQDISHIRNLAAVKNVLSTFAAWSSKYMDVNGVLSKLEISRPTFNSYANALTGMYIHEALQPWVDLDYDRVGRRAKSFLTDSGLMAGLLDWDEKQLMFDPDRSGKLVETFIFHELLAHIGKGSEYTMNHYRDRVGHEIDFVIRERSTGNLLLIDAKAGTTTGPDDFRHMRWFRDNRAPQGVTVRGMVLYSGKMVYPWSDGFMSVPTSALWM